MSETPIEPAVPVPHYYGDTVRALFVLAVFLAFAIIPFWGHVLPFPLEVNIGIGMFFVVLAGLTSPHGKIIMAIDVLSSGAVFFVLEWFALNLRSSSSLELFLVREVVAFIALGALYFSVKTLRAMLQGRVGKSSETKEF